MIESNTKIAPLREDLQNLIPIAFLISPAFKRWIIANKIDELWQHFICFSRENRHFITLGGDEEYDAMNALTLILNHLYMNDTDHHTSFFYFIFQLLKLYVDESNETIDVDNIKKDLEVAGITNENVLQLDSLNLRPQHSEGENNLDGEDLREKVLRYETVYTQLSMKEPNSQKAIDAYIDWHKNAVLYLSMYYSDTDADYVELKNLDNSGNGFSLKTNYQTIRTKYSLLMEYINKKQIIYHKKEKTPMVFISHSSKDKEFVEALVELLEFLGFTPQTLFCSSVTGYGISLCSDIYETLRSKFEDHDLFMIFILSPNYYHSVASLNEMGAAWVLKSDYCSFLTSNMDFNDMKGVVNTNQISIKVNADDAQERLNQLRDMLVTKFQLKSRDNSIWEHKRSNFLKVVNSISCESKSDLSSKEDGLEREYKRMMVEKMRQEEEEKRKASIRGNIVKETSSGTRTLRIYNSGKTIAYDVEIDWLNKNDRVFMQKGFSKIDQLSPQNSRSYTLMVFNGSDDLIKLRYKWKDDYSNDNVYEEDLQL